MRIGFIGAGRVAATLAPAMRAAGYEVTAVCSRTRQRAEDVARRVGGMSVLDSPGALADSCDLVFVTVPDDAIERVCRSVSWTSVHAVVHCSGATEVTALDTAKAAGAQVGSFHPLQMFANPEVALATLPGCTVTVDADAPLVDVLTDIGSRLGCRTLRLARGRRALYHASAYYVGPFLIALMREAAGMWRALGASEPETLEALLPLLQGTLAAVKDSGLAGGMGGCVARGDVGTVERHLAALEAHSADALELYRVLALRTVPLAIERGTLANETADVIRSVLAEGGIDRRTDERPA